MRRTVYSYACLQKPYAKAEFGVDVYIHLFPNTDMALKYTHFDALGPTFMCAEDYFLHEVEASGVNEAEKCRDIIRDKVSGDHPFDAFLAYKDRDNDLLYFQSTAPSLEPSTKLETLYPFAERRAS